MVVAVIAVGAAGCGGDDDGIGSSATADQADADGSSTETGDDGSDPDGSAGGSGASVDGDFPIPIADGVLLDVLADAGVPMAGQRQLFYPEADFDRIVAFYEDWVGGRDGWARTELDGQVFFQQVGGDGLQAITIAPQHDGGAQADGPVTFVLLVAG